MASHAIAIAAVQTTPRHYAKQPRLMFRCAPLLKEHACITHDPFGSRRFGHAALEHGRCLPRQVAGASTCRLYQIKANDDCTCWGAGAATVRGCAMSSVDCSEHCMGEA
jgi:hypothetical protein